jgi:hypothetical protein
MNKSILFPIHEKVWAAKTLEEGRSIILNQLDTAPVQSPDIKKMRTAVCYQINSKTKLDYFISNELLAYGGMKVIK